MRVAKDILLTVAQRTSADQTLLEEHKSEKQQKVYGNISFDLK